MTQPIKRLASIGTVAAAIMSGCASISSGTNFHASDAIDTPALIYGVYPLRDNTVLLNVSSATASNGNSVLMIPGGGLNSSLYSSTADGRPGWAQFFANRGYNVFLSNPPAPSQTIGEAETKKPRRHWRFEQAKVTWGLAAASGENYEQSRFPFEYSTAMQVMLNKGRAPANATALEEFIKSQKSDVIIVAHSAGARMAYELARRSLDSLRAIVLIEPLACSTDQNELKVHYIDHGISILSIWGDRLDRGRPNMQKRMAACESAAIFINSADGSANVDVLPARGIRYNSHVLMIEDNSDAIAQDLLRWIESELGDGD